MTVEVAGLRGKSKPLQGAMRAILFVLFTLWSRGHAQFLGVVTGSQPNLGGHKLCPRSQP